MIVKCQLTVERHTEDAELVNELHVGTSNCDARRLVEFVDHLAPESFI